MAESTTYRVKKNDKPAFVTGICIDADGRPVSLASVSGIKFQMKLRGASTHKVNGNATAVAAGVAFTAAVTDIITATAHGLEDGDRIMFSSTGTLPAGLNYYTVYYVVQKTTNTFKVSTLPKGEAVNITDTGTGTHTIVSGKWKYTWAADDLNTEGTYNATVQVTFADSTIETFPAEDFNRVIVGAELA